MKKADVYITFYTNSAVAWFTVGVITPFFTGRQDSPYIFFPVIGILGAYGMLSIAERLVEETYGS